MPSIDLLQIEVILIKEKVIYLPLVKIFSLLIFPLSKIQKHHMIPYLIFTFLSWGRLGAPDEGMG